MLCSMKGYGLRGKDMKTNLYSSFLEGDYAS